MKSLLPAFALLALAACGPSATAPADSAAPPPPAMAAQGVSIVDPWIAATPNGAQAAAGYLTIRNDTDAEDKLISAASPRAKAVELHEMTMTGAVMDMHRVESIAIPAHGSVQLGPGGKHLMLIGFDAPFVSGQAVPVTLTFEKAGAQDVTFPVRPAGG
jgi:copper(I)-binding protein